MRPHNSHVFPVTCLSRGTLVWAPSEAFSCVIAPTKHWALERESHIVSLSSAQGTLLRQP